MTLLSPIFKRVNQNRPRKMTVIAILMIVFGLAEVTTGITHKFFGLSTVRLALSTYIGVAIGSLYTLAGLLVLPMKRQPAGIAIVLLIAVIFGRIGMVVAGLYPVDSFKQILAMVLGTSIVGVFVVYIRRKRSSFL
jgi:hypothetical protein